MEAHRPYPLFASFKGEEKKPIEISSWLEQWKGSPIPTRRSMLHFKLKELLGKVLGYPIEEISIERGFFDMGMDSLMAVELRKQLETLLGRPLSTTTLFSEPSILQLSDWISHEMKVQISEETTRKEASGELENMSDEEILALLDAQAEAVLGEEK